MKKLVFVSLVLAAVVSWLVTNGLKAVLAWSYFPVATTTTEPIKGSHAVAGRPTMSAEQIDRILTKHHSPFAGRGKTIYALGLKHGIDPAYAMAFWLHESGFGTLGWAKTTKNPGNIRGPGRGGWTYFDDWDDGMEAWFRLIKRSYVDGGLNFTNPEGFTCSRKKPCLTVEQILPVYAPSSDGNNVARYVASVNGAVENWRLHPYAMLMIEPETIYFASAHIEPGYLRPQISPEASKELL